jgi:transposase
MLRKMDGAGQIETVIIDMSLQFRSAIEQALPQATIVIDRFHIQRTANEAMDNVRKRLHKKLKTQERKAKMCHAAMLRKR